MAMVFVRPVRPRWTTRSRRDEADPAVAGGKAVSSRTSIVDCDCLDVLKGCVGGGVLGHRCLRAAVVGFGCLGLLACEGWGFWAVGVDGCRVFDVGVL